MKDRLSYHDTKLQEREARIKFTAEVCKVQTLADGGIRLTLDLAERGRLIMADLAECQQKGIVLRIEAKKVD